MRVNRKFQLSRFSMVNLAVIKNFSVFLDYMLYIIQIILYIYKIK